MSTLEQRNEDEDTKLRDSLNSSASADEEDVEGHGTYNEAANAAASETANASTSIDEDDDVAGHSIFNEALNQTANEALNQTANETLNEAAN